MQLIQDILEQKRSSQNNYYHYHIKRRETKKIYPNKEEKKYNKIHSKKKENSDRAYHIFRLKNYIILADAFRNKLRKYDRISDIYSIGSVGKLQNNERVFIETKYNIILKVQIVSSYAIYIIQIIILLFKKIFLAFLCGVILMTVNQSNYNHYQYYYKLLNISMSHLYCYLATSHI